ncbi:von Willebrand factor D and EGF domain-containing protein-like [Mytilus trossulus]|uniref:von Willebrand factor D and EGF domain-containing protein-like n=1 Tax=Mytilus trossulus TaxID=6551 RepID=UPI00300692A6
MSFFFTGRYIDDVKSITDSKHLDGNRIEVIKEGTFDGLNTLYSLSIRSNQLTTIENRTFHGMYNLNYLYLDGNSITEIGDESFEGLNALTVLNLNDNQLMDIPSGLFNGLVKLTTLKLNDNQLMNIPSGLFNGLAKLNSLYLNGNNLKEIPNGLLNMLPQLTTLSLTNNAITDISYGIFDNLHRLRVLYLDDNMISDLSFVKFLSASVTSIDVSGNMISGINDGAFIHSSSLSSLNIGFNPITDLDENAFIGLPNLRSLNIGFNPITELDENAFIDLPNLRTLDLSGTELTVINRRIFQHVPSLNTLYLKNMTSMTTLDGLVFEQLTLLSYLDLSGTSLMCDCGLYKFAEWLNKTTNLYSGAFPGPVGANQNMNRYVYTIIESCRDSEFDVIDFPYECPNVPSVNSILAEGPIYQIPNTNPTPSLVPVFICSFEDKWTGKYNYDVKWEIDGDEIKTYLNVSVMNINTTFLRDSDWTDTHNMNMVVRCGIRVNDSEHDKQFIFSSDFRAGIFADQSEYIVVEGEYINITLKATVPIGCIASNDEIRSKCFQDFHIFQPSFDESVLQCSNLYGSRNIVFKNEVCGISMTDSGKNVKNLQVYGFSDGLYNYRDRSTYINMYTASVSTPNAVWQNFNIKDIKVTVKDGDALVKNRCCRSYNDPHITTFDGKTYHYHEVGEFVMYRNDKGPYWVHALFTNCNDGFPGAACHCGVAIRSRNSLFVVRTCQTISRNKRYSLKTPLIYIKQCDPSDMFIQQLSITKYKVTLPIGTEIIISFHRLFISSIIIKPSYHDINMAKGLCGFPSTTKDTTDDFMHRYYGVVQNQRTFADSWRINDTMVNEQLFFQIPTFLKENFQVSDINQTPPSYLDHFCVCGKKDTNPLSLDDLNTAQCQLTSTTDYCVVSSETLDNRLPTESLNCLAISRKRKRSVNSKSFDRRSIESDDVFEFLPLTYDDDVYSENITAPAAFKNSWTEENATSTCRESIQNALPSHIYSEYVDLSEDEFVESCVLDIMATGDTTYIVDTIDAMATIILVELSRNEYIHIKNMTEGNQTVLDYITGFLCANNCSDNGNCVSGVCACYEGYMGDSCAEQTSSPPSDTSLPNDGLCSIRTKSCITTNVYGNFQSTTVWYKRRSFQITENGTVYTSGNETDTAEYRHLFMVTVPLKISRRKRSTEESMHSPEGYEISLSNDGSNFGESFNMIVYDENCFTCNSTSVTCDALVSYIL